MYISPVWDYLFEWYSRKNQLPPPIRENAKVHFLIIEPFMDSYLKNQAIDKKKKVGILAKDKNYNGVVIQKWIID